MSEECGGHESSESGAESHSGEAGEKSHDNSHETLENGHEEQHSSEETGHGHGSHGGKESKSKGHKPNSKANAKGKENSDSKKSTRTLNGAVALIVYEDSETGKVEFYFEEKPQNYYLEKYRGKLSMVGGAMETTDPNNHAQFAPVFLR